MTDLRPYQQAALDASYETLAEVRSALVVMPTGCGKTHLFVRLAERVREHGRTLVLAHREVLVDQAAGKVRELTDLTVDIEMGDRDAGTLLPSDVVVASVQTMSRRLEKFGPDHFALIVIDEAHRATGAQYLSVLERFSGAKVLGVTATPDRDDDVRLGAVFDRLAFVYEPLDAMRDGWLVPVRTSKAVLEGLDLSTVRVKSRGGDFNDEDLEAQLVREDMLRQIASTTVQEAGDRPTIIFTAGVRMAHRLAEVMEDYVEEGQVFALDGSSRPQTRRRVVEAFKAGEIQYLCNCALFTEGFDAPATACVAVARPTHSWVLLAQMIGRGTRLAPGKEDLRVLLFHDSTSSLKLAMPLDILGGTREPGVQRAAQEKLDADPDLTLAEAVEKAEADAARAERAKVFVRARYSKVDVDPFAVVGAERSAHRGDAPSGRQASALRKFGVDDATIEGMDRRQASAMLDRLCARADRKLCTFKQARLLMRQGLNPDVSFDEARRLIDELANNRWRVPAWMWAQYGVG